MAAIKETYLLCDTCNKSYGENHKYRNAQEQRDEAGSEGWIYSGNKDYCENCRPKKSDGTIHSPKRPVINVGPHHSIPNTLTPTTKQKQLR